MSYNKATLEKYEKVQKIKDNIFVLSLLLVGGVIDIFIFQYSILQASIIVLMTGVWKFIFYKKLVYFILDHHNASERDKHQIFIISMGILFSSVLAVYVSAWLFHTKYPEYVWVSVHVLAMTVINLLLAYKVNIITEYFEYLQDRVAMYN